MRALLTLQFVLVLMVWFFSLAFGQLLRVAAPVAIEAIVGVANASNVSSAAFTASGVGGLIGVLIAQRFARPGRLRAVLVLMSIGVGLGHLLIPLATQATSFIAVFALITILQASMVPATNTLIAMNAPRDRRGTAFGLASGMQAIAFMVGPMAAAGFAAVSLNLGFVVLGVLFVVLGLAIRALVREPAEAPLVD